MAITYCYQIIFYAKNEIESVLLEAEVPNPQFTFRAKIVTLKLKTILKRLSVMIHEHGCENCEAGCTGRHNAEERSEEVKAGPYLLLGGALILLASIVVRWLFY
jgi:hypothetical protein